MSTIQEFVDSQKGLSTYQLVPLVIQWASEAALQTFTCTPEGEEADDEGGMGLWQSFQTHFPKRTGIDYDMLVTVYGFTYTQTVRTLNASRKAG